MQKLVQAFPIWTILASGLALIEPSWFTWFSGSLITWGLGIIMLSMGLTLKFDDFAEIARSPKGSLVGVALQYTIMPLLGWLIANFFNLPTELMVGLILVACCPGGTASNVICYLAKANVALSVAMTAVSTLLAVIMTPLLTTWLVGSKVEVNTMGLFLGTLKVVILPICLGLLMSRFTPVLTSRLRVFSPLVAVIVIVLIVASIIGAGRDQIIASAVNLIAAVFTLHALGFSIAFWAGYWVTGSAQDARAISIEVGMQNSGLGAYLARSNFANPATAIPSAVSSLFHCVIGSIVAAWWSRRKNNQ
ncbi:bile acid:sodium symporter family protein [Aliikangiella maris]|uniref:Bile acid:sodium symporter family protein n=2 Tax=Aliikangiella maris TaxID=3162458 RepID=A0ABV2BYA6_9GAMM